jgi:tetratricopeptide (TPR) repeat protein
VRGEADSLLARAETLDPTWIEPTLARARIAHEVGSAESLTRGIELVERALASHSANAEALTVRGALQMALARQAGDSTRAAGLLVAAERDLRIAVASDPTSARAWITLADLLYNVKWELSEARQAARRAYEEDVFLLEDDHFKWLCEISIQLEDHEDAARWCEEGRRRFPDDVYLMMADLTRLASAGEAEAESGWALVREIGRQRNPGFNVPAAKMYMAAILARAGDADSARATARAARQGMAEEDRSFLEPSLDYIEAYMQVLLGDERSALRLLRSSFTGVPPYRAIAARDYWFESLEGDPRFESLVDRIHLPIFCQILCRPPQ